MLALDNIFSSTINKFADFYNSLSDSSRFAFFAIIFLIILIAILAVILIDQFHQNKKIISKKIDDKDNIQKIKPSSINLLSEENGIDEENEKTKNLKEITDKMREVLDGRSIDLTDFEQDQEENSIISYNDLLKTVGKPKEDNVKEEKFKINEVAKKIEASDTIEKEHKTVNHISESRFRTSDFISPIYGIQSDGIEKTELKASDIKPVKKHDLEDTEIIDFSNDNSEEEQFLNGLKNLRSNLN